MPSALQTSGPKKTKMYFFDVLSHIVVTDNAMAFVVAVVLAQLADIKSAPLYLCVVDNPAHYHFLLHQQLTKIALTIA